MEQRRHACPQCSQTYLRATHLHSHLRTHLSEEDRPFACDKKDCGKKFWTAAHLKRHQDVHDQAKVYQVSRTRYRVKSWADRSAKNAQSHL